MCSNCICENDKIVRKNCPDYVPLVINSPVSGTFHKIKTKMLLYNRSNINLH